MSNYTKIKNYTDKQLINKVKSLSSFKEIPKEEWMLVISSLEDTSDTFDDKIYFFKGEKFIMVTSGTANSGKYYLNNPLNSKGTAIIATNQWVYNMYAKSDGKTVRHHNDRMECLRQVSNQCLYYRDNNKDDKVDEIGSLYKGNYSTNYHTNSYTKMSGLWTWIIGKFGAGCIVTNNISEFYKFLNMLEPKQKVSLCIIKEF